MMHIERPSAVLRSCLALPIAWGEPESWPRWLCATATAVLSLAVLGAGWCWKVGPALDALRTEQAAHAAAAAAARMAPADAAPLARWRAELAVLRQRMAAWEAGLGQPAALEAQLLALHAAAEANGLRVDDFRPAGVVAVRNTGASQATGAKAAPSAARVRATGPYPAILRWLAQLGRTRAAPIVTALDMRADGAGDRGDGAGNVRVELQLRWHGAPGDGTEADPSPAPSPPPSPAPSPDPSRCCAIPDLFAASRLAAPDMPVNAMPAPRRLAPPVSREPLPVRGRMQWAGSAGRSAAVALLAADQGLYAVPLADARAGHRRGGADGEVRRADPMNPLPAAQPGQPTTPVPTAVSRGRP